MKTKDFIDLLPYSTRRNARYSITSINQMIKSYEFRSKKKVSSKTKDEIRFVYLLRIILHNYSTSYHSINSLLSELKEKNITGLQIGSEKYTGSLRDNFMINWKNVAFDIEQILLNTPYRNFLKNELPLEKIIKFLEGEENEQ